MRCPNCHRKVHKDDIYCVWCSASLRGRSPEDPWNCVCADETAHRTHAPRSSARTPGRKIPARRVLRIVCGILLLSFLPVLLSGIFFAMEAFVDEMHTLTVAPEPQPEPILPEDAWKLGTVIAQWEDVTITANAVSVDSYSGELEMIITAENRGTRSIVCAEADAAAEDYCLPSLVYLELEPGETVTDYFWIETDLLQAAGISHLGELTLSFLLTDSETYANLAWTEPASLSLDFTLPEQAILPSDTTLAETDDLTVTLVGFLPDWEHGGLTLYTLMENRSDEWITVSMDNARSGGEEADLFSFYTVPAGRKLLAKDSVYGIPYSDTASTGLSFDTEVQDVAYDPIVRGTAVMTLDPDGGSGSIRSEWE